MAFNVNWIRKKWVETWRESFIAGRGSLVPLSGLILDLDGSDSSTLITSYQNLASTITGTSGLSALVCSGDESLRVFAGMTVRANGVEIYTVQSVATSIGVTTITVVGTLSASYAAKALAVLKISQWNDKSGQGNNATQGTAANQPIYYPSSVNSKSTLIFDGTAGYFNLPTAIRTAITNSTSHTLFFVFRATDLGAVTMRDLINSAQGGAGSDMMAITLATSNLKIGYYNGSVYATKSTAFTDTTGAHIISSSHVALSTPICALDGVNMAGTNPPSANTQDGIRLGGETQDLLKNFQGYLCEVIMYNRVLSAAEIAQVKYDLAGKWNIIVS